MANITFSHSGNLGDIIASLPFVKTVLRERKEKQCDFTIRINAPANYNKAVMFGKHPAGDVMVNEVGATMLKPLLKYQPYIDNVAIKDNSLEEKAFDLSAFRNYKFNLAGGMLSRFYEYNFALKHSIRDDLQWLVAPKIPEIYNKKIVLSHSMRYPSNAYIKQLKYYVDDIVFIGVDDEYEWICNVCGCKFERVIITDFLQYASIVNSCKLFISNQTFGFQLAEGLKVKRFILRCDYAPNVIPTGVNGFTIYNNVQFREMLKLHCRGDE